MKIAMIMLAAGNSRRFGSNKLLYEIEGKPMYLHGLENLVSVQRSLTVVTQYEEVAAKARSFGAQVLYNPHPEDGIASSLKIGLEANLDADACLFAVADQPWIKKETVEQLLNFFVDSKKGIACAAVEKQPGNPCVFSKKYYPELLSLTGDRGGKKVVLSHPEDSVFYEIEDVRELADIDRKP